jgi:hypothetical protein
MSVKNRYNAKFLVDCQFKIHSCVTMHAKYGQVISYWLDSSILYLDEERECSEGHFS